MIPRVIFALCMMCLLIVGCSSYHHGDALPMQKRAQYKGYRSKFETVLDAPRFGVDKIVAIKTVSESTAMYGITDELKMSFNFAHEAFITEWITITDGQGKYLDYLEFQFDYSHDYLRGVTWSVEYHTDSKRGYSENIYVRYVWNEKTERNPGTGFNVLFVVCICIAWGSAAYTLYLTDPVEAAFPGQKQRSNKHT